MKRKIVKDKHIFNSKYQQIQIAKERNTYRHGTNYCLHSFIFS